LNTSFSAFIGTYYAFKLQKCTQIVILYVSITYIYSLVDYKNLFEVFKKNCKTPPHFFLVGGQSLAGSN
jgi:hypothetical protein